MVALLKSIEESNKDPSAVHKDYSRLTLGGKSVMLLTQDSKKLIDIDDLIDEADGRRSNPLASTCLASERLVDTYGLDLRLNPVTINRRLGKAPRLKNAPLDLSLYSEEDATMNCLRLVMNEII